MGLGALWYSPVLFGKQWMQRVGKPPETLGSSTLPMAGSVTTGGIALDPEPEGRQLEIEPQELGTGDWIENVGFDGNETQRTVQRLGRHH